MTATMEIMILSIQREFSKLMTPTMNILFYSTISTRAQTITKATKTIRQMMTLTLTMDNLVKLSPRLQLILFLPFVIKQ